MGDSYLGAHTVPILQHFNPTTTDWELTYGRNNALRVEIYGPDGSPLVVSDGKLAVRVSEVESLIESIIAGTSPAVVSLSKGTVTNVVAITPHDANNLTQTINALYVGVEGDVKVDLSGAGSGITLKGLAPGMWHPIAATKIYSTGTTATDILGAY
jgi:hypothetical protein